MKMLGLFPDQHKICILGPENNFFLDKHQVLYIASGGVNLFIGSFDLKTGEPVGPLEFIAGLQKGQCIFPFQSQLVQENISHKLLVAPLPDTELRQNNLAWPQLLKQTRQENERLYEQLLFAYENFILLLLTPFSNELVPPTTQVITSSDLMQKNVFDFASQTDFRPGQGLLWVNLQEGTCILNGDEEQILLLPGTCFPLSPRTWLHVLDEAQVKCLNTRQWLESTDFASTQDKIFKQYIRAVVIAVIYRSHRRFERQKKLAELEKTAGQKSVTMLRRLIRKNKLSPEKVEIEALGAVGTTAVERIGRLFGLKMSLPEPPPEKQTDIFEHIGFLLTQNSIFYRRTKLEHNWWREEGPVMIGWRNQDNMPLVLNFQQGRWMAYDCGIGQETKLSASQAKNIHEGLTIYNRLPPHKLKLKDILKTGLRGLQKEFRSAFIVGLLAGILALIPSRLTSTIFNSIIPRADYFQLIQAGIILLSAAFSTMLFQLTRSLLMLRIKSKGDFQLQAALWGRLLSLPATFFESYSTGDLAQRIMGIDSIRSLLADNVTESFMSLIFALPNLILMFYYSPLLTLIALLSLGLYSLFLSGIGMLNFLNQKKNLECEGTLAGFIFQIINGIAKIKISASENRVHIRWSNLFSDKIYWHIKYINNLNKIIFAGIIFPPLASGLFFWAVGSNFYDIQMNIGSYLAFNAAFTSLLTACTGFAQNIPTVMGIFPLYKRLQPILQQEPEVDDSKPPAGTIDGSLEIKEASYRYSPDGPLVLDKISITAEPGQSVAIVGPSGAGKSTIIRLLLGFDAPETGGIFYGSCDLANVNKRDLRRQIGTVLQGGGLFQGSIYQNIAGASGAQEEDIWQATRLAGCEQDILDMPMKLHTMVYDGTVSGGQRQRILIARALIHRPRVVLFDEATSALDNETQAIVADSLDRLNATRIIIAHRLSTIINVDKIYVLEAGKIVQCGTFKELINAPGLFNRLANRQML